MAMTSYHVRAGRPVVVWTGMGVVTSLGVGQSDNWTRLTDGQSGIREITRFPTDSLRTRVAGTVDFVSAEPFCGPALSERLAASAGEEAVAQAGIGRQQDFPGPLFLAMPPVEIEWPQLLEVAAASGANDVCGYDDLLRTAAAG